MKTIIKKWPLSKTRSIVAGILLLAVLWRTLERRLDLEDAIRSASIAIVLQVAVIIAVSIFGLFALAIAFTRCLRKIRQKGHSLRLAILIPIGSFLFASLAVMFGESMWLPSFDERAALVALFAGPASGIGLFAAIAALLPNRSARTGGERTEWRGDVKLLYGLAAFLLALIPVLLFWRHDLDRSFLAGIVICLSGLSVYSLVGARMLSKRATSARYLKPSQANPRYVLYLREFEQEARPFAFPYIRPMSPAGLEFLQRYVIKPLTLERYLSGAFESRMAPLVALGRPDDYFTPHGAAREYLADDAWQERFKELAVRSNAILLQPGSSTSLNWEMSFLQSKGLVWKLFLILGPLTFSQQLNLLNRIRTVHGHTSYEPLDWSSFAINAGAVGLRLMLQPPKPPALIAFDDTGNGFALPGTFQTPIDYVRAIEAQLKLSAKMNAPDF